MLQLKYFTQEGNQFKMKPQYIFFVLAGFFFFFGIIAMIKAPDSSAKWWLFAIAIIVIISISRQSLIIDLDKKEIVIRRGLIGNFKNIAFNDLRGFTIHKLKYMGFITTNVTLLANYNKNGKIKQIALRQGFNTKPIQNTLNDLDEILAQHGEG